jgi:hypothetical protein
LSVVASAIGSHIVAERKRNWNPPPIIWSLVVAPSGARKTHTQKPVTKPLITIQREFNEQYAKAIELYEKEKKEYEASLKSKKGCGEILVKPEAPKRQFCYVSDTTTEMLIPILADNPYGVCSVYDEGMTFFGSLDVYRSGGGGKDEGIYNEVFDGGYVQVTRKTGNQFIAADRSHCSICVGVQPETLKMILKRNPQFLYSGFLARFLMCMPPDTSRHINDDFIPEDVENAYHRMINTLFSWRNKARSTPTNPCRLPLTPAAKALFDEYHNKLEDERASLPLGAMKAILSKLSGYAMRIALTLHIAHFASHFPDGQVPIEFPRIDEKTMKAAIILTKWYRREAQRVLLMLRPTEIVDGDKDVASILGHVQNRGGQTTARFVAQNITTFDGDGGTERATKKLEEMVQKGLLIADDQKRKNGKLVRVYSFPSTTYADNGYAIPDEIDNGVDSVGDGVGGDFDANPNENNDLEDSVGVGDLWGDKSEENFAGRFAETSGSPRMPDANEWDCFDDI